LDNLLIDIFFGVRGSRVSVDHGYALYGAVAAFWKRTTPSRTMAGCIIQIKSECTSFAAPMVRTDGFCSVHAQVSD
jgi:hypothetical protein